MNYTTNPTEIKTYADLDAANKADGHYARRARPDWLISAEQAAARAWADHDAAVDAYLDGAGTAEQMHDAQAMALAKQQYCDDMRAYWLSGQIPASVADG